MAIIHNLTLRAAKLEFGDYQTLAHQDASGNWVLNDQPPNKALELAKCQMYFERIHLKYGPFATGFSETGTILMAPVIYSPKRANPVITFSDNSEFQCVVNGTYATISYTGVATQITQTSALLSFSGAQFQTFVPILLMATINNGPFDMYINSEP